MRVDTTPDFRRALLKAPEPVRQWALDWVEAAEASGATLSDVLKGSEGLKGGHFRNCRARKWRRKIPHGEFRLVFRAEGESVIFFSLDPRGDDYKTAARRARAMKNPAG